MSIQVRPGGILKSYTEDTSPVLVDAAGEDVRTLLEKLRIPSEMVAMVVVNGALVEKDFVPQDQDVVQLLPLLGGGQKT